MVRRATPWLSKEGLVHEGRRIVERFVKRVSVGWEAFLATSGGPRRRVRVTPARITVSLVCGRTSNAGRRVVSKSACATTRSSIVPCGNRGKEQATGGVAGRNLQVDRRVVERGLAEPEGAVGILQLEIPNAGAGNRLAVFAVQQNGNFARLSQDEVNGVIRVMLVRDAVVPASEAGGVDDDDVGSARQLFESVLAVGGRLDLRSSDPGLAVGVEGKQVDAGTGDGLAVTIQHPASNPDGVGCFGLGLVGRRCNGGPGCKQETDRDADSSPRLKSIHRRPPSLNVGTSIAVARTPPSRTVGRRKFVYLIFENACDWVWNVRMSVRLQFVDRGDEPLGSGRHTDREWDAVNACRQRGWQPLRRPTVDCAPFEYLRSSAELTG